MDYAGSGIRDIDLGPDHNGPARISHGSHDGAGVGLRKSRHSCQRCQQCERKEDQRETRERSLLFGVKERLHGHAS